MRVCGHLCINPFVHEVLCFGLLHEGRWWSGSPVPLLTATNPAIVIH